MPRKLQQFTYKALFFLLHAPFVVLFGIVSWLPVFVIGLTHSSLAQQAIKDCSTFK